MYYNSKGNSPKIVGSQGESLFELLNPTLCEVSHLSIAHLTLKPTQSTTLHYHPNHEEIYYVLGGTLTLTVGAETKTFIQNELVFIPKNQIHAAYNHSDQDVNMLIITSPEWTPEGTLEIE